MSLAQSLERRIEHLVEGLGSKVFPGQLHPVEVAIRIVREAELALTQTGVGPTAPNVFVVSLSPDHLGEQAGAVASRLTAVVQQVAGERGWRLEGPVAVSLNPVSGMGAGAVSVETAIQPGPLEPWAHLIEVHGSRRLPVGKNRALVGRSRRADVMLGDDTVSRAHALLWHDAGGMWVQDLASSNGTSVNGRPAPAPGDLRDGDVIGFGTARFSFRRA